jgi:hypothetical protein
MMNRKTLKKFIFLIAAGAISLVLLIVGSYQLYQYTDSTAFCGVLCHKVMNPEYTTYQSSPHSRVLCSSCHVGPGASYLVKSKIRGIPQLFATIFNTYPTPITSPVNNLRPATDTCEQCHRPEFFTGDLVKTSVQFKTDTANTEVDNSLVMRVGGGVPEVAGGIHWHIAAKVWYLPMDETRQEIGWVGVETAEGKLNEFINQAFSSQITQDRINKEKRLMDCVDCHNRATHIFQSPEQLIDAALQDGRIDKTLPYAKKEALSRLDPLSTTLAEANARVDTIRDFYKTSYPQINSSKQTAIDNLVTVMKDIVTLTVFPEMKVTWETHINNLGHIDSAGCFRCHKELVSKTATNTRVVSDCNTCHYVQNTVPSAQPPVVPHTLTGRSDCLSCHGTTGTQPVPSSHVGRTNSTCTTCHASSVIQPITQTPIIPHTLTGLSDCLSCHNSISGISPVSASHTGRTNSNCTTCHVASTVTTAVTGVSIPHIVTGDCASCHGLTANWPFPASHTSRTNSTCILCHAAAPVTAPNVTHATQNAGDCLSCHSSGKIVPYPSGHNGWTSNTCSLCHQTVPVAAPSIPHTLSGRTNCVSCHRTSGENSVPRSHAGWTIASCTLCHTSR